MYRSTQLAVAGQAILAFLKHEMALCSEPARILMQSCKWNIGVLRVAHSHSYTCVSSHITVDSIYHRDLVVCILPAMFVWAAGTRYAWSTIYLCCMVWSRDRGLHGLACAWCIQ